MYAQVEVKHEQFPPQWASCHACDSVAVLAPLICCTGQEGSAGFLNTKVVDEGRAFFPKMPIGDAYGHASSTSPGELRKQLQLCIDRTPDTDFVKWGPDAPSFTGLLPDNHWNLQPDKSYLLGVLDKDGSAKFFPLQQPSLNHLHQLNSGRAHGTKWALGWNGPEFMVSEQQVLCLYKQCQGGFWHLPTQFDPRDSASAKKSCSANVPGLRPGNVQLKHKEVCPPLKVPMKLQ